MHLLNDVDSFNYIFFSLKVSFISYINLWTKFQNSRQRYLHPLESSTFHDSVFWTLALSYLSSGYETPQSDTKRLKLLECILTGNSKLYLGKVYTKDQLKKLSNEEVDKVFNNYEAKLSGQLVKSSLGCSIINMYSMGACAALGISNQDSLSGDLESDSFLNSALQKFTWELYYRFGSFLAPLSVVLITSRHYLSEQNKNGE